MTRNERTRIAAATGADPRTVKRWVDGEDITPAIAYAFRGCCGEDIALSPPIAMPVLPKGDG